MGKLAFSIVALSFLIFLAVIFSGGELFFGSLRVAPEEILGNALPEDFQVEQSISSEEGNILVGIDRSHELRVHVVKSAKEPLEADSTAALLRQAKVYRVSGGERPGFLTRYLAANVDPRRAEIKHSISIRFQDGEVDDLLLLTAQKQEWFAVTYLAEQGILLVATHPDKEVTKDAALGTMKALGFQVSSVENTAHSSTE
ncbi:MAG: hypothetical protein KDD70_00165 [Bdellovibrionales bacterium]|nr:hypothetical protein [Bdellovibrionales bacterium]